MKNKNNFNNIWDYFEGHIRCINLITRKDRYEESKKVFDKYKIPVRYFYAKKHPKGGVYGCFDSHIRVIREAYYSGAKRVLIFEDDITPTDYLNVENLKKAIKFMKTKKDWDLFYLGALPEIRRHYSRQTKYPGIYRLHGVCTHAYIVNRSAMKKLINLKFDGTAIDYYYINNFNKCYALYPTLFLQGLSKSDIGSNWWAYYGTKDRVATFYRCIEWYAYHINYPLTVVIPIVLIIILILIGLFLYC
jgi:GR25 family glycosyltransferase involved in LPS biosynthesis